MYPECTNKDIWASLISLAAPTIWNSLPSELRHSDSKITFKPELKAHLLSNLISRYIIIIIRYINKIH